MPELPEVETVRRQLQSRIAGKKIKEVKVRKARMLQSSSRKFHEAVTGAKINAVKRRGKMVIIDIAGPFAIGIHLKMTGQLVFAPKKGKMVAGGHPIVHHQDLPNKYSHVIFKFTDGTALYFNDVRQFGWVKLFTDEELKGKLAEFGVEPLSKAFTWKLFKELADRYKSRTVKKFLMDQKTIAGIGNIYADEIAFYAKVKPMRPVSSLTDKELRSLYSGTKSILALAVRNKGTTTSDFVTVAGEGGYHGNFLKVYGREGEKCKRPGCKGKIQKGRHAQRGTHYCAQCQR